MDSHYDVYLHDGALVWVRQPCSDEDARGFAELWAEPADPDDPRADGGDSGTVSMNFAFLRYGAKIGDLCVIRRPLPDYPIRRIGIGQNVPGDKWLYRTAIPMPVSDEARAYYIRKYETVAAGGVPLLSGAEYGVYLDGGEAKRLPRRHSRRPPRAGTRFAQLRFRRLRRPFRRPLHDSPPPAGLRGGIGGNRALASGRRGGVADAGCGRGVERGASGFGCPYRQAQFVVVYQRVLREAPRQFAAFVQYDGDAVAAPFHHAGAPRAT